ncbi:MULTISPECIES: TlpA disulfide reductase family protein [unclassified Corynebacterium]|uniref:TlpA disulfide reductase family protein n=1 Tax=unclassified Corynebacterium TaxID=2624378 RepID=UPI0030A937F2
MRSRSRILTAVAATAMAGVMAATLVACGDDDTVGHDAVAIGGQFEFVSPGGKQVIEYAPEDRAQIGEVYGESLTDKGKEISLADFKDQIVVLNAWGQWCAPCRSESDDLQVVHEKMQDEGIGTVLGINVRDNVRQAPIDFAKDNGLTYPSIYDPPFLNAGAMGGIPASVVPTTIILDRQHRPAAVYLKEITEAELWKAVEKVRNEEA